MEIKTKSSVVIRGTSSSVDDSATVEVPPLGYAPKSLFEEKPKNRSVKANFKN